ncbi:MAG: Rpn family recombination-promoting nuclease/putative transposase [Lachnospiraceae bacterium]|nr:Rpn family recombination-promoting nuclease/putative transposase [Lachnospiraceae bacterium]
MSKVRQSRMDAIQQGVDRIVGSNLLSDTLVSIALEDPPACQYVLRKILGQKDLKVVQSKGQYRLLNLTAKDSVLDVLAEDSSGRLMNVEMQRRDTVDHARRTRYYGSMLDKSSLDKGLTYDQLPDVYIIYISETDMLETGETVSRVKKTLGKDAKAYDDGSHVIYVNAEVDDGSEVAEMMKYFKTADPDDMSHGALSERIRFLKREKGGYEIMCEAAEQLINWGIEQGIEQGIERGVAQGDVSRARKAAKNMRKKGLELSYIAEVLDSSIEQVEEWLAEDES